MHHRPMWNELKRDKILEQTAFVFQQKMWEMTEELELSGMPPTDAREQAEAAWLMLAPDEDWDDQAAQETPT